MKLRLALLAACAVLSLAPAARAQDTVRAGAAIEKADTAARSRLDRVRAKARAAGVSSLGFARSVERSIFVTDSAVERWSQRGDGVSRAFRAVTPIAFWVPVAGVTAVPLVWADESEDGHALNAAYARNTAAALALGFAASRTAKHLIRRARPCTGEDPGDIAIGHLRDSTAGCPAGSHVSSYSSFFSEHAMALFAMAAATSFQAQRRNAPNAGLVTVATFSGASLFSVARIYQRHHWLSDVLVGAAVGTASGFAAAQVVPATRRR